MFERFTEEARRSLFFARHKTTERNGFAITDEDLLHGISLAAPAAIELLGENAAAALRKATRTRNPRLSTSVRTVTTAGSGSYRAV